MRTGLAYLVDAYRQEHHFFVETPSKLGLETHTQVAHLLLQRKLRFSGKCFSVDTWARYRPLKQVFSIPQSVSKRCASTVNADEITKHIDGSIQQPTLARLYFSIPFVPTRVVLRIACWYLRLVTRRAVIPMSHCLCGLRSTAFAGRLEWHKSKGKLSVTDTVTQQ